MKIFSLDNFAVSPREREASLEEQVPYLVIGESYQFSPHGTKLLIPGRNSIVDLRTKNTLETFGPHERVLSFLSENIILESIDIPSTPGTTTCGLFVLDKKQRIALAPPARAPEFSSGSASSEPLVLKEFSLYEGSMKLVYREPIRGDACIFDIRKQLGCWVREAPGFSDRLDFDTQGTLYCMGNKNIEQLMIDPTDCSLDQIFFLLGFARALGGGTSKIYTQLLASSIFTTFPAKTKTFLTEEINKRIPASATSATAARSEREEPTKRVKR